MFFIINCCKCLNWSSRIRTDGFLNPNQASYQTRPYPKNTLDGIRTHMNKSPDPKSGAYAISATRA